MIVSVRGISARCAECNGAEFHRHGRGTPKLRTRMRCARCGHSTTYRALLEAIGEQAMVQANKALEKLTKPAPPRSRRK